LGAIPGVDFFSLQKGEPAAQAREPPGGMRLIDLAAELHDFNDTAARISHLGLVVTVDTSVAHLAGALNKPVWVPSRFGGCWRWLNGRKAALGAQRPGSFIRRRPGRGTKWPSGSRPSSRDCGTSGPNQDGSRRSRRNPRDA
jgi:hypothetical protein